MKIILLALSLVFSIQVQAATVFVGFAGGQSNMKQNVSTAIESVVHQEQPNAVVVRQNWSGNSIWKWSLDGVRQSNYLSDLAFIRNCMDTISQAGDTPVFSGLFWFQGEGDIYGGPQAYTSRFLDMIGFYTQDLGVTIPYCLALIDYDSSSPEYTPTIGAGVDSVRGAQKGLGELPNGSYFDTRGFARVDPWHLNTASQTAVGTGMGQAFAAKFVPEPGCFAFSLVALIFFMLKGRRRF